MRKHRTETMAALLVLFLAAAVNAEYIFTFPKSLEAQKTTSFCLSNSLDIVDFLILEERYNVNISLTLKQSPIKMMGEPAEDNITQIYTYFMVFSVIDITSQDLNYCGEFPVPKDEGIYKAEVEVLLISKEGKEQQVLFTGKNDVKVIKPDYITLIQTDKPIYKPGQTVKFRAMVMDYLLTPELVNYTEIYIQSPQGHRLMQWKDVHSTKAFISLEMPLGDEPFLGKWKIKAEHSRGKSEASFKVEEYVLPKYEVVVTPPTHLLPTTKMIDATVCARYTYGEPVKGNVSLTVRITESRYRYSRWDERPVVTLTDQPLESGCFEMYLNAEALGLSHANHYPYGQLKIDATVTEEGTNIQLTGSSDGPGISRTVLNLRFEDDSNNYYKPGFPYRGRLIVTNTDGSPAPGEDIQISASSGYDSYLYSPYVGIRPPHEKKYSWKKKFTSDEDGVVHFVIIDVDPSIGFLSLTADAVLYEEDDRYNFNATFLTTDKPKGFSSIRRWHSASNSYIYIPDIDQEVACGSELELEVFYTTPKISNYNFQSMVKAGDRVVYTNVQTVKFDGVTNFDAIAINPDQLLTVEVKVPEPPVVDELPIVPEAYAPLGEGEPVTGKTVTGEPVKEEIIVPEVAKTLGNEVEPEPEAEDKEPEKKLIGKFILKVPVTHDMSPDAQLLVYYMREDGEIIPTTVKFKIEKCFRNKVEMSFKEKRVRPGSETEFTLKASPSSTCFVGMVDKSINLLGGQNQLTPAKVFAKVREVARPHTWVSYWREDNNYCDRKYSGLSPRYPHYGHGPYRHSYMSPIGVDAVQSFRDFNSWVLTDGVLETRPCKEDPPMYYMEPFALGGDGLTGLPGVSGIARAEGQVLPPLQREEVNEEVEEPKEPERIRSLFPETWLWDIYELGNEGKSTIQTTMPDTITEWVGNSVCAGPEDGVGVSEITSVTGFQPFFVSLTLPYSAVRGENLTIPVTVFNYLNESVRLDLRLERDDAMFLLSPYTKPSLKFCLDKSDSKTVNFEIMPIIIGEIELIVKTVSIPDNGACTNSVTEEYLGASDGVQRSLLVEAEGVPQEKTMSDYVCIEEGTYEEIEVQFEEPDNLVPDSEFTYVSVIGDIMGPTLSNLENLLRMPYGCGEQNMASWAPNIYVLQYLKSTNQLTDQLEEKAKGYMRVGYQRQMKYRHLDSSYSAFGENSWSNADGSIWLTAFVVKSMAQSSQFIEIDENDIARSVRWILDQQLEDGSFPRVGKVFSSYMKGGLSSGDNLVGLTAFIMIALQDAGIGDIAKGEDYLSGINRGLEYLRQVNINRQDTYTLTLLAYVFYRQKDYEDMGKENKDMAAKIWEELEQRKSEESGLEFWKRADVVKEPGYWWRYSSAEVEMTAYVILALLSGGKSGVADTQLNVQWLTKQRNPYGGFSSTQDTVVALQALAEFGKLAYSGDSSLDIKISHAGGEIPLSVTPDTMLLYQREKVYPQDGSVKVKVGGSGCALVQISTFYNIYQEPTGPAFKLDQSDYEVLGQEEKCATRALRICTSYLLPGSSNMAIIEVKMPTGWEPMKESLEELQKYGLIERFEVQKKYIQLYFEEITGNETCVVIEAEKTLETDSKPAVIRVYDYYETAYSESITYNLQTSCEKPKKVPTKQDIPKNNEGLDCSIMQCRVLLPPPEIFVPKGCPKCYDTLQEDLFRKAICDAKRVYKAVVGRRKKFSIKLMANFTTRPKTEIGAFVNPEMGEECASKCQIMNNKDQKVFFLTIPKTWEARNSRKRLEEVIKLGKETTIVKLTKAREKIVNDVKKRKPGYCKKMERRRRSRARNLRRRNRLRRKN